MARSFLGGEFAGGESAWWRGNWIPLTYIYSTFKLFIGQAGNFCYLEVIGTYFGFVSISTCPIEVQDKRKAEFV